VNVDHVTMLTNAIAPDKLGGLERYVSELSAGLVSRGVRVTVLTKRVNADDPLTEVTDNGVEIVRHVVPSKRNPGFAALYPYRVTADVRKTMNNSRRTVLHGHFPIPALWPSLRRAEYVYTFHNPVYKEILEERHDSYLLPKPVQAGAVSALKQAERAVLTRARTVIALSDFSRTELELLDPDMARRAKVIPGGVDTDSFSPSHEVSKVPGLLLAARRLTPRTGVLELIRAMPRIVDRAPNAVLAIAGDGGSRELVESEIHRLGLGRQVQLLGRLGDEELRHWYRKATLSIVPSQAREGFGLSTVESLATGTPALVTPVGANVEIARRVDSALVAGGISPEAIAEGVTRLLLEPGLLDRVSSICRARVAPAYSWPSIVDQHLEIYERSARALRLS
jgi:glycosyltransferase involved in cell wall biosynthesis